MQYEKHAERLLREGDRLPGGALQRALFDEATRVAGLSDDESLLYRARLRIVASSARTGNTQDLLTNMEWCLDRHLEDSDEFPAALGSAEASAIEAGMTVDLAVEFAAIPPALASSTVHSLETIDESLDELRELLIERVERMPHTEQSQREGDILLTAARAEAFDSCGRERQASEQRTRLKQLLHDHNRTATDGGAVGGSDAGHPAEHPLLRVRGAFSPGRRIAESLLPLLARGQLSDAYLEHLRGYDMLRNEPGQLGTLVLHLRFLLESGSLERGLLLAERHLHWLAADPLDERSSFDALLVIGELLDAICEAATGTVASGSVASGSDASGSGERGPGTTGADRRITAAEHPALVDVWGQLVTPVTAEVLGDACWGAAARRATAFDTRNGTRSFDDQLARAEARSDIRCEALARRDGGGETAPSPSQPTGSTAGLDLATTPWWGEERSTLTSADWLQVAKERASVEDPVGARAALRQAHDLLDREEAERSLPPVADLRGPARARRRSQRGSSRTLDRPHPEVGGSEHPAFDDLVTGAARPGKTISRGSASGAAGPGTEVGTSGTSGTAGTADTVRTADTAGTFGIAGTTDTARGPGGTRPTSVGDSVSVTRCALLDLEIRLAIEQGDLTLAEELASSRVGLLVADGRQDLADVELELGLLMFGVPPQRRSGDLERALTLLRDGEFDADAERGVLNALGELRLREGRSEEAIGYLLAAVALCGHDPDSTIVQRPLALLAHAQLNTAQPAWARATLDRLLRHDLDRAMRARALLMRARVLQQSADLRVALDDADRALSLHLELRYSKGVVDACATLASLLEELGIRAGVVEAWRMAVTEAQNSSGRPVAGHPFPEHLDEHPDLRMLRLRLARALVSAERGDEAAAELLRLYDQSPGDVGGAPGDTVPGDAVSPATTVGHAEILFWLGHAQRLADDDEAAYASWSLALRLTSALRDARGAVRSGLALGRLLLDDDDPDGLDVLKHTLDQARLLTEDPSSEVDALHLLGIAQCAFGDATGLETLDDALDLAARTAFDIDALIAEIAESRARAFDDLGLETEALISSARAARLYERLCDRASAGRSHLFTARLLVTLGRHEEALPVYRRSLDMLPPDTPVVELALQEWHAARASLAAIGAGPSTPQLPGSAS
ncbi:hypothetical protein B7R21_00695 [Subtercola boreus]|uniref:Uncharacterized protein n=1 Tax=Subtercola boreus TaxID=120213 RepID=A0A3E0W7E1_9MICO|nr:hypothetical protein [Subtercola boreus]RFA17288.1 hypothetical protein B7R21_00695 [Subtercola boreus]